MLRLKRLSGLMSTPKVSINIAPKATTSSLKRLRVSSDFRKTLELKRPSSNPKKQSQHFSLYWLKLLIKSIEINRKTKITKARIVLVTISVTKNSKKALSWLLKLIYWSPISEKTRKKNK